MISLEPTSLPRTITIVRICLRCKHRYEYVVDELSYIKWQRGTPVQYAFPQLKAHDREILVSQICGDCFEKMCKENDNGKA